MLDLMLDAETAEFNPTDRKGEPIKGSDGKPWLLTIAGPSHPASFQIDEDLQRKLVRRMASKPQPEDDDVVEQAIHNVVARTLGWTPIELEGKDFPYSPDNVRLLYAQSSLIRKQVERFAVRASNFMPRPSVN